MTKQDYNDYIEALKARGYKFGGSWYNKPYYRKVIGYREGEDGNRRPVCVIFFNLCETKDERSGYVYYSIEPIVTVSRNTDELLNFGISKPKRSIEEYEHLAEEFLRWVDRGLNSFELDCTKFPSVKWEDDEPTEAYITLANEPQQKKEIDWEQLRFKIANDVIAEYVSKIDFDEFDNNTPQQTETTMKIIELSIKIADALLGTLKQQSK